MGLFSALRAAAPPQSHELDIILRRQAALSNRLLCSRRDFEALVRQATKAIAEMRLSSGQSEPELPRITSVDTPLPPLHGWAPTLDQHWPPWYAQQPTPAH